ncbi:MAG TPA: carbohydrate kinase [Acidobacteriaceae bacterium]|nr:carbohydrate kinase [Acidobacteriaceae bacterium]
MTGQEDKAKLIAGIGELLWDLLPAGAQLGGAVSNFAVMSARLGGRGVCASRVGRDELGGEARERISRAGADASFLQEDSVHPTGSVSVTLKDGQPEYVIHSPVAWDFLELTDAWLELARRADAVCFGTLAQRAPVSSRTIQGFLAATAPGCVRVYDVNLRPPFYSAAIVERSLMSATLLKMNDAEAPVILDLLGLRPPRLEGGLRQEELLASAQKLLQNFPLELVCITMGDRGSLLVTRKEFDHHPGIATKVADTVGAGDAFTAAMVHYYLRQAPLAVINEAGNRWGSWVASQAGGMPALGAATREFITGAILRA